MHVGGGDTLHLGPLQEDEDVHHGGGGRQEAKKCFPRAGLGEEQGSDGAMEQEVEKEWLPSHQEARVH